MERIKFSKLIDAPREKVWDILWKDETYRQWTSPFMEGSYAVSDWNEGSKILFLSPSGEGMVSRIARKQTPEFMSFEHLGEVKDGVEDTESERVKKWAGATENYYLSTVNGKTELRVEMDIDQESGFADFLLKAWPPALEKVKELSERAPVSA